MSQAFSTGVVLKQTFSVFFRNIVGFALMTGVILSPVIAGQVWTFMRQMKDPSDPIAVAGGLIVALLGFVVTPIATGALTYGVFQQVRGRPASVADCLTTGLKRLLPVLGVSLLAAFIMLVGTLLCLVPGLIAMCILAAAVPAAVVERPGVIGALSRSERLTKGYRWQVFGVLIILGLLNLAVSMPLVAVAMFSPHAYMGGYAVITILSTGLQACAGALIYYHLRRTKEAIDVEEMAAVFD